MTLHSRDRARSAAHGLRFLDETVLPPVPIICETTSLLSLVYGRERLER